MLVFRVVFAAIADQERQKEAEQLGLVLLDPFIRDSEELEVAVRVSYRWKLLQKVHDVLAACNRFRDLHCIRIGRYGLWSAF